MTILSVIDTVKATEGYVRPMREGEQVLMCGLVISVGVKEKKDQVLHIQALVLRTSGLTSQHPYLVDVWVDLNKEYGSRLVKDQSLECQCPAGRSEKCKHVVALMLYLARVEEHELEDLSCTDTEQQWGALKASTLKDYQAKKLTDLCHVKCQKDVYVSSVPEVTKEMEKRWADRLSRCEPLSEFSIFFSHLRLGQGIAVSEEDATGRVEEHSNFIKRLLTFRSWQVLGSLHKLTNCQLSLLDPVLKDFYEAHVKVSLDGSCVIGSRKQGTPEWSSDRSVRVTASRARSQYTYYKNRAPNWDARYQSLYHSKFKGNEFTEAGHTYEGICRDLYEDQKKCNVYESGLLVRPELPWLGASLDGTVLDEKGCPLRNIEIKDAAKEGKRLTAVELVEMNAIKALDKNGNMKTTNDHYGQIQIGMLLSGVEECDYLVYSECGKDYVEKRIKFDPPFTFDLVATLTSVYFCEFLPRMQRDFETSEN